MSSEPAGYVQLLRENAPFRRLFSARVISLFGDWFSMLAVLALLRSSGLEDAGSFGWVLIIKMLPGLFAAPLAGVIVDRFPRKAILIAMDLLRVGIVFTLIHLHQVVALIPGHPLAVSLYSLVALQAVALAISEPARMAVMPDLVAPRDLVTANALGAASWSVMFALGIAIGGLVTDRLGWRPALWIDLSTFAISAALLIGLRVPDLRAEAIASGASTSFLHGVRYLLGDARLWTLALAKAGWSLAGAITLVLTILGERAYPVAGRAILGVTVLYLARAFGTGVGPVVSRMICRADPARTERLIGWGYLWAAALYAGLALSNGLVLAAVCVFVAHLGGATVWVFSTVRLQAQVPTEVRGRVFAIEAAAWKPTFALSTFLFGLALDRRWVGPSGAVWVLALSLVVPGLLWLLRDRLLGPPEAA